VLCVPQLRVAATDATFELAHSLPQDNDAPPALLLVSAAYPLPDDYQVPELVTLGAGSTDGSTGIRIAATVQEPLENMLSDSRAAGVGTIFVSSGYRTHEEQARLYESAEDKSYVQPPGASEHETGLALDLGVTDFFAQEWLVENSWRYGFIVRYPAGKEHITGISFEQWHFRYVGVEAAAQCYEQDICLEEYLGMDTSGVNDARAQVAPGGLQGHMR
jgi:D-alanyl-D-alanine carboxypeptidase